MDNHAFIEEIAALVRKYAPLYDICVCSPAIAQAILESHSGTSYKATFGHNYHGLKYRENRVPVSIGKFTDTSIEDRGDYNEQIVDEWFRFANMEDGVHGYFQFINIPNYANLKGVTDPRTYVENIKADKFATDDDYVEKIMNIIEQYNLTKYDNLEGDKMAENKLKIVIDAGHGLKTAGKRCMKKLDPKETREWYLNDRIADKLEALLKAYECEVLRVDDTTGNKDVSLADRCKKSNAFNADVYISIHHNAGINGGIGGGTIVYYYSSKLARKTQAQKLYDAIVKHTKLIGNRSSKIIKNAFYVLKNTNAEAFLIENGFMDSATDVPVILTENHANKTAQGLLEFLVNEYSLKKANAATEESTTTSKDALYRVQCGAFKNKETAEALKNKLINDGYAAIVVNP